MKLAKLKLPVIGAAMALSVMGMATTAFAAEVPQTATPVAIVQTAETPTAPTTEPTFGAEGSVKAANHAEPFLNNGEPTVVLNGRTFSIGKSGTVKYKGKQIAHMANGQLVIDDASYKLG